MTKPVLEIKVLAVLPTAVGRAVFLGNERKAFIIYVDSIVGTSILAYLRRLHKTRERPLTHDLMIHLMVAMGAKVERVIINDLQDATYFARLIISAENELHARKIIELDARPSDSIALALAQHAPIYITRPVWEEVEDMSDILRRMIAENPQNPSGENPNEEED